MSLGPQFIVDAERPPADFPDTGVPIDQGVVIRRHPQRPKKKDAYTIERVDGKVLSIWLEWIDPKADRTQYFRDDWHQAVTEYAQSIGNS